MGKKLFSFSTALRNPNRLKPFLSVLNIIEGESWNDYTQEKFQILLIQHRLYEPSEKNLNQYQIELLNDKLRDITFEEAKDIFYSKNYESPSMRGRNSFKPLERLGLAFIIDKKISISEAGKKLLNNDIELEELFLNNLIKLQYPNPLDKDFNEKDGYNIKPFVATLKLIKEVNDICREKGIKEKGISKDEFGIFALSLCTYENIRHVAEQLVEYRLKKESLDYKNQKIFIKNTVETYLNEYTNGTSKNVKEYSDNMIRYFRMTKYLYIRGGGYYIDLEPRRTIEINKLLDWDNASSTKMSKNEYIQYLSVYDSYTLPWETTVELKNILSSINNEINELEIELNQECTDFVIPDDAALLKKHIKKAREYRTKLQNLIIKNKYSKEEKIDEAISALTNIKDLGIKPSIALEKWSTIALNIINDSLLIKPNYPVGDDNEPTYTAPGDVPDIECYYKNFTSICEVTMLTGRNQWYNEGQPIQRHLREHEIKNSDKISYCLFVAPTVHRDTLNTFWTAVKYEYEGEKQYIIPLKINQLIKILECIKILNKEGRKLNHLQLKYFYEKATNINNLKSSNEWPTHIDKELNIWIDNLNTNTGEVCYLYS